MPRDPSVLPPLRRLFPDLLGPHYVAPRHSEWVLLKGPHGDDAPAVWPLKLRSLAGRALRVTPRPTGGLPSKPSLCGRIVRLCDGGNGGW